MRQQNSDRRVSVTPTFKVLIVGASGFVGCALSKKLLQHGHIVTGTRTQLPKFANEVPGQPKWIAWDAMAESLPVESVAGVDVVIYAAAPRPEKFKSIPKHAHHLITVTRFSQLLETAASMGGKRVILISTGDVFGSKDRPASESDKHFAPDTVYGKTKLLAETALQNYGAQLETAVARLYHPYGPGGERFLICRLIDKVRNGETIKIEGYNGILLNPIWIDDLVEGLLLLVNQSENGNFHFAGPVIVSLRQLINQIAERLDQKPNISSIDYTPTQRHVGGFQRTRQLLGFNPSMTIVNGLENLL